MPQSEAGPGDLAQAIKLGRLRDFLLSQKRVGYKGKADTFLKAWAAEAFQAVKHPMFRTNLKRLGLVTPAYDSMSADERTKWVEKLLKWVEGIGGAIPAEPKPAARPTEKLPATTRKPLAQKPRADLGLDTPVTALKGVTPRVAAEFAKLGVSTIRDLLYFFPRRHNDFANLQPIASLPIGQDTTVVASVWEASEKRMGVRRSAAEAVVGDESGNIRVVWFNQPYLAKLLQPQTKVVLSGKVSIFKGHRVFENPEYELMGPGELIHTGRLVPVYPLTSGLRPKSVRRIVKLALDTWAPRIEDFLPVEMRRRLALLDLPKAILQAHFPDSAAAQDQARKRLAFDELFLMQLTVLDRKQQWKEGPRGYPMKTNANLLESFTKSLPYALTEAQQRSLNAILDDMARDVPMSRLLQGDVGSGKTVVATMALLMAVSNGYQGALMAPTEILATQHFKTIRQLLGGLAPPVTSVDFISVYVNPHPKPISIALLTGGLGKKRKQELHELIRNGDVDIAVGTHALIEGEVEFPKLGLAVVDEQHRFGVMQRAGLRKKGSNPHLLVMTATPIPRTLALTLYGDLDISVIDKLPPGRQEILTKWLRSNQREAAYQFVRKQVQEGRQAFIICPLVEESEAIEAKAAVAEHERLSTQVFPDLRLGLLHGRMTSSAKDSVMRQFAKGELDILVSTAVVEVGIDVPNATVMLVEDAGRFGLSQLHQFRGRVGRGEHKSYCMLLSDFASEEARERLSVIERTRDGFLLAEEDLRLRGPGEFFGTRQSGLPDLRMARLSDTAILELARKEATLLFASDPNLSKREHAPLAQALSRLGQSRPSSGTEA